MAYVQVREGAKGTRYQAMYRDAHGKLVSAGTFDTERRALEVGEATEKHVRQGASGKTEAERATTTLKEYRDIFLRNHEVAPVTKRNYQSVLDGHVLPYLGKERVAELDRETVRAWLATLKAQGKSASLVRRCRVTLSAVMTMAVDHDYRDLNPARGQRTPRNGRKQLLVLTKDQFKDVHAMLPTEAAQAMALLIVNTGLRFGEATALLGRDVDTETSVVYINKAVSDVGAEWHPNGQDRFIVNPYPKSGHNRTVSVKPNVARFIAAYMKHNDIGPGDLLFPRRLVASDRKFPAALNRQELTPERLALLGTFLAANGREYQHGSMNGYVTGKCRCDACRQAITEYSMARRHARKATRVTKKAKATKAGVSSVNSQGLLPKEVWSRTWMSAVKAADIPFMPTAYQLRHTHASWLIDAGASPKEVMDRLGHSNLSITELYVHRVAHEPVDPHDLDDLLDEDVEEIFDLDDLV